jgi:hypothetical protein
MFSKSLLEELYLMNKLSMKEIAMQHSCSVHKVEYWMKQYSIQRRSRSEANYQKYNPTGDPFKIKKNLDKNELYLKGIAVGIYWGEGNKRNIHSVRVGNTDPKLIYIFTRFLREICCVREDKIRFGIQLFSDVNEEEAVQFWMNNLNITKKQILPTISRIQSGKIGTYKSKNIYGVMTVQVNNRKLRDWLNSQLVQ